MKNQKYYSVDLHIGLLLLLGLSFPVLAHALPGGKKKGKGPVEIIILHTNDIHSKIDNMGKLAYLADSLERTHPFVFLVSAGDNFTGNPVVDMVEEKGYPMIDLMNRCGFNASAIGNHEFDMGQEMLNHRVEQANFPFICANIDASEAVFHQPPPYTILKAGKKVKIALLGLIQVNTNGLPDSHPDKLKGLKFMDYSEVLPKWKHLRDKNQVFIGLTHLGLETDNELARKMPELDLIIGGHSHDLIDSVHIVYGVLITQSGSGLRNIGKITILVKGGKVIEKKDEEISVIKLNRTDPEIQKQIDLYNNNQQFARVVAMAKNEVRGDDQLGSMMTDAITQQLNLDIAFQNVGGIRVSALNPGNITLKDLYKLDPFGNKIVVFKLTPVQIQSLILNAYNRENSVDLMVSGITYKITVGEDGKAVNVEVKNASGNPLDKTKTYSVGMNSYMASTYTFEHSGQGTTLDKTCVQALIDFLDFKKIIDYSGVKRVSVIHMP